MLGKKLRMSRIFRKDGKTLIVAMDHGAAMPVPGLEKPGKIIRDVIDGGADAIVTSYGLADRFGEEIAGRASLILRLDGGSSAFGKTGFTQLFKVEDAVQIGADAVLCMGFVGSEIKKDSFLRKNLGDITRECKRFGIPLLAEMLLKKKDLKITDIKLCTRIGAEMGADFVKAPFVGTRETYKEVVENCFVPIVILGGEKTGSESKLLEIIEEALESGVRGVCIGRNIWQSEDPKGLTKKIADLLDSTRGR